MRGDQKIKVAFWLNTEDLGAQDPRDGRTDLSREEVDALLARRMDQVKAATSRATEGLTRALERAGHAVDRRAEGAPVVFAHYPQVWSNSFRNAPMWRLLTWRRTKSTKIT